MLACAIKLELVVVNFAVVQKLTARSSGISKVVKTRTMMAVRAVVQMINVNMKEQ